MPYLVEIESTRRAPLPGMQIAPVVLEGAHVRLEPLTLEAADEVALAALAAPPELWAYIPYRMACDDDVRKLIEMALALHAARAGVSFVTRIRETGEVAGGSAILRLDAQHRRVEIGFTWILPRWQRTFVNTEAKLLQLAHCFEDLGAMRVELKADARNARSRAAITRLGAVEEGTLRRHMFRWDGTVRDSVLFSIVDSNWPETKARLARLLPQA
jgi:N-acetyltransferase